MTSDLEARYRSRSFWLDSLDEPLHPRPPLERDVDVDVAIVGAGYTGLWTAYELARRDPTLRIAVLEAEIAGFGASGRNGGWCSALFAGSRERNRARHTGGRRCVALQRADVRHGRRGRRGRRGREIDADFRKGGTLELATAAAQVPRLRGGG